VLRNEERCERSDQCGVVWVGVVRCASACLVGWVFVVWCVVEVLWVWCGKVCKCTRTRKGVTNVA